MALAYGHVAGDTSNLQRMIATARDSTRVPFAQRLNMANEALTLAGKEHFAAGEANALRALGILYRQSGNSENAIKLYHRGMAIAKANKLERTVADMHTSYGVLYTDLALYDSAFLSFARARDIYRYLGDTTSMGAVYNGIAHVYMEMGDYAKSKEYLLNVLSIHEKTHNNTMIADVYTNIAIIYYVLKDIKNALWYDMKACQMKERMGDTLDIAALYQNIGVCYYSLKQRDSALYWYTKALNNARLASDVNVQASALLDIGDIWFDAKKWETAEKYYNESYVAARKVGLNNVAYLSQKYLSEVATMLGKHEKAFNHLQAAAGIKDSMLSAEKLKSLTELTTKYEVSEITNKNALLRDEIALQSLLLKRKDILVYTGFGVAFLFLIITILVVTQNRVKAKKEKLELEQKQLLAQINPHFMFNCLNSIQQFVLQNDTKNATKYLSDFAMLMQQTLDNSRDSVISLRREKEYLENYLMFEQMRFEEKFSYSVHCSPEINQHSVYIPAMIIQPFAENAIKHGLCNLEDKKGILTISFSVHGNLLRCEIDDNGIGIEESRKLKEASYLKYQSHGMDITSKRLALVSGSNRPGYAIQIEEKRDAQGKSSGTKITVSFPLESRGPNEA